MIRNKLGRRLTLSLYVINNNYISLVFNVVFQNCLYILAKPWKFSQFTGIVKKLILFTFLSKECTRCLGFKGILVVFSDVTFKECVNTTQTNTEMVCGHTKKFKLYYAKSCMAFA